MAKTSDLKQPLLEKEKGIDADEQVVKKAPKKSTSKKAAKAVDEQEVSATEQGPTEGEEEPLKPVKAKAAKKEETEESEEPLKPVKAKAAKKEETEESEEPLKPVKPKAAKKEETEEAEEPLKAVKGKVAKKEDNVEEEAPEAKEEELKEEEKVNSEEEPAAKGKLAPKDEFKAAGDVALLAASPHLEHEESRNWSEKNEQQLQTWKQEAADKIKECDAQARGQANLGRMLVIPATILGAMTTASSSLSALVKDKPALSYAAAVMSLILTILTALHTSLNPEKQVQSFLVAKDKYVTIKNKIEATLAIDVEQRGDTGAHFILEIQQLLDKADDSINQLEGGGGH